MAFPSTGNFSGTAMPGHTSMGSEGYSKFWEWSYGHARLNCWCRATPPQRCVSKAPFCFPHQKDWSLWLPPDKPDWHPFFSVASFIKALSHTPRIITPLREKVQLERIQSFPLKRVFPVSISAMIQPIDQISTVQREKGGVGEKKEKKFKKELERQQCLLGLLLLLLLAASTDLNFTPSHPPLFFLCC